MAAASCAHHNSLILQIRVSINGRSVFSSGSTLDNQSLLIRSDISPFIKYACLLCPLLANADLVLVLLKCFELILFELKRFFLHPTRPCRCLQSSEKLFHSIMILISNKHCGNKAVQAVLEITVGWYTYSSSALWKISGSLFSWLKSHGLLDERSNVDHFQLHAHGLTLCSQNSLSSLNFICIPIVSLFFFFYRRCIIQCQKPQLVFGITEPFGLFKASV